MIGVMGGLVSNSNMGCVALTYSLIGLLERISSNLGIKFNYTIFEFEQDYQREKYSALMSYFNLDSQQLKYSPIGYYNFYDPKLFIKKIGTNLITFRNIRHCDIVIDLTQGDSFTDIYGEDRFFRLSNVKWLVEKMRIPLILGPQTYGPFIHDRCLKFAASIINNANAVFSRDKQSAEYLAHFCKRKIYVGTDLAFGLPYNKAARRNNSKIKVGINPSVLLSFDKNEKTDLFTAIRTDYDKYIRCVIQYCLYKDYEVHLIPHVGNDGVASFCDIEGVITHCQFQNPIEAKSFISTMDIFIGARMHATIAAFSSGVATIPNAYSPKFSRLYNAVDYNYIIDLATLNTEEALNATIEYISAYNKLKEVSEQSMKKVKHVYSEMEKDLCYEIQKILSQ